MHGTGAFQSVSRFKANKNGLCVGLNLLLQCAVEVSRGQKEIRPIHGKIGPSVAIKKPLVQMEPLVEEAAQVLIVKHGTAALCNPPFCLRFLNIVIAPGRDQHKIKLLGLISSGLNIDIYIKYSILLNI